MKNINVNSLSKKGQSLFEVLFAVAVIAIILVSLIPLSTISIRNASFSNSNAIATKYAKEASEWLRQQRDVDWGNLDSRTPGTVCLGTSPITDWGECDEIPGTIFTRTVTFAYQTSVNPDDTIEATIVVSWSDSQGDHEVRTITRFTNWNL